MKYFPYSPFKPPSSNISIPVYDRATGLFDEIVKVSDCGDVILISICNCFLYNQESIEYSTK